MLLVYIFALLALGEAEDGIITSPGPGNEYVRLQASGARSYNLSVPQVQIEDEGLSGVQKQYPIKKAETTNFKKISFQTKSVADKDGVTGLPPKKALGSQKTYDVLSNRDKVDSGGIDFEDDTPLNGKKLVPAGSSQASRVNVKKGPNGQDYEYEYVYYYYDDEDEETTTTVAPTKSRRTQDVERGSSRRQETPKDDEEPKKAEPKSDDRSRSRYTTIERGKTVEPATNEVLPRGGTSQRTRGRQMEIEEERLPSNTRFPSRNSPRGSSSITTLPPTTIQTEVPPSRTRNSGNHNIRRPSLVDSSSFRTHSSELPSEADQEKYYTRGENANTRESDLEEYIPATIKPTTYSPPAPIFSTFAPKEEKLTDNMPDKAALDLYAILQQTQEENYVSPEPVYVQEPETTEPPTTTTTEAATTTTTTTTTAAPQLPGRGRLRTVGGRPRTRPSHQTTTTTTTTQAPQESSGEPVKKSRFHPSRQGSFGRRGSQRSSTTQSTVEESSTTQRTRSFGGSNRNSYNWNRGRQPVQNQEESEQETTSTTTVRPTRARLSVARPLRPGPKFNLRSRVTTTVQPISSTVDEVTSSASPQQEEIPVEQPQTPAPAPPAPQDALSRLRNRPRLRVSPRPAHTQHTTEAPQPPQVQEVTVEQEEGESQPSSTEATRPQSQFLKRRPPIRRFNLPSTQQ